MKRKNMKYAIVDLEATGTGSTAKIIQVGIVILENGEIKQTYQTDINPHDYLRTVQEQGRASVVTGKVVVRVNFDVNEG